MKIDRSVGQAYTYVISLDAGELVTDSGKAVPYPFYLGTFTIKPGKAPRVRLWTPAASKPRGYAVAARRMLDKIADEFAAGRLFDKLTPDQPRSANPEDSTTAHPTTGGFTQDNYRRGALIVAQRQAALRANGDDERNTPAWIDALREGYELRRTAQIAGLDHKGVVSFATDRGY